MSLQDYRTVMLGLTGGENSYGVLEKFGVRILQMIKTSWDVRGSFPSASGDNPSTYQGRIELGKSFQFTVHYVLDDSELPILNRKLKKTELNCGELNNRNENGPFFCRTSSDIKKTLPGYCELTIVTQRN